MTSKTRIRITCSCSVAIKLNVECGDRRWRLTESIHQLACWPWASSQSVTSHCSWTKRQRRWHQCHWAENSFQELLSRVLIQPHHTLHGRTRIGSDQNRERWRNWHFFVYGTPYTIATDFVSYNTSKHKRHWRHTWCIPGIVAGSPGNVTCEWRKRIEEGIGYQHIIVDAGNRWDTEHCPANTCKHDRTQCVDDARANMWHSLSDQILLIQ